MRSLDLFWRTNSDWWELRNYKPTLKETAPPKAKKSYERYLVQKSTMLDGWIGMRIDKELLMYDRTKGRYEEIGEEMPLVLEHIFKTRHYIRSICNSLDKCATNNAISKRDWEWLANVKNRIYEDVPQDLYFTHKNLNDEVEKLWCILENNKETYLVDGYTLRKEGKKLVREVWNKAVASCKQLEYIPIIIPGIYVVLKDNKTIYVDKVDYEKRIVVGREVTGEKGFSEIPFEDVSRVIDEICKEQHI